MNNKELEVIEITRRGEELDEKIRYYESLERKVRQEKKDKEKLTDVIKAFACITTIGCVFALGMVLGRCMSFLAAFWY